MVRYFVSVEGPSTYRSKVVLTDEEMAALRALWIKRAKSIQPTANSIESRSTFSEFQTNVRPDSEIIDAIHDMLAELSKVYKSYFMDIEVHPDKRLREMYETQELLWKTSVNPQILERSK